MFSNSVAGISDAFSRQAASAERLAGLGASEAADEVDLAAETTEQLTSRHAVVVNTGAINRADQMLGELLDIIA